jgi:hypothetical protein
MHKKPGSAGLSSFKMARRVGPDLGGQNDGEALTAQASDDRFSEHSFNLT